MNAETSAPIENQEPAGETPAIEPHPDGRPTAAAPKKRPLNMGPLDRMAALLERLGEKAAPSAVRRLERLKKKKAHNRKRDRQAHASRKRNRRR